MNTQGKRHLNYKRLYLNLKNQTTRYERTYNDIKLYKTSYRQIFGLIRQLKNTSTTNFIEKYHKNKLLLSNKIAYLAGLVDGEGYLKVEKHGTVRLIIGMCSKNTIYWIKNNFGGSVKLQKTGKGRKFWVWRMNQGKDLFYLLLLLIPFLVNKKQKLLKAFELILSRLERTNHTLEHFHKGDYNVSLYPKR